MALRLTTESDELQGMQHFIEEFERFGSVIAGVELNDIKRVPYDFRPNAEQPTNSFLLQEAFPDQERDFVTLEPDQERDIGAAFEAEAQKQIDRFAQKATKLDRKAIQRKIDQAAGKSYIAAMKAYMAAVRENIDNGRCADNTLSPEWSELKEMHFGRT